MCSLAVLKVRVQHQGAIRVGFWWGLSSWLADSCLLTVSSDGLSLVWALKTGERSGVYLTSYKNTSPTGQSPSSWPHLILTIHISKFNRCWGLGFNIWILERHNSFYHRAVTERPQNKTGFYFSLVHHTEVSRQLDLVSDSILYVTEDLGSFWSVAWPFSRWCPYTAYPHYVCPTREKRAIILRQYMKIKEPLFLNFLFYTKVWLIYNVV